MKVGLRVFGVEVLGVEIGNAAYKPAPNLKELVSSVAAKVADAPKIVEVNVQSVETKEG